MADRSADLSWMATLIEAVYATKPGIVAANAALTKDLNVNRYDGTPLEREFDKAISSGDVQVNPAPFVSFDYGVELGGRPAGADIAYGHMLRACGLKRSAQGAPENVNTQYRDMTQIARGAKRRTGGGLVLGTGGGGIRVARLNGQGGGDVVINAPAAVGSVVVELGGDVTVVPANNANTLNGVLAQLNGESDFTDEFLNAVLEGGGGGNQPTQGSYAIADVKHWLATRAIPNTNPDAPDGDNPDFARYFPRPQGEYFEVQSPVLAESMAAAFFENGVNRQDCVGVRGTAVLTLERGAYPGWAFTMQGLYEKEATVADVTAAYAASSYLDTLPVTEQNTPRFYLNDSGGLKCERFSVDLGNTVVHRSVINDEAVRITRRRPSWSARIVAVDFADFDIRSLLESHLGTIRRNSIHVRHGNDEGKIFEVMIGGGQLLTLSEAESDNLRIWEIGGPITADNFLELEFRYG